MPLSFKPIALESRSEILRFLHNDHFSIADISFGNLYIWKHARAISYAICGDSLIIQTRQTHKEGQNPYFFFPIAGDESSKLEALKTLESYARENGFPLYFERIETRNLPLLRQAFPAISIEATPDRFDYVYSIEELIALSGRKFHKKKNHLNSFLQRYEWEIEPITQANASELAQVARIWLDSNPAKNDDLELEWQGICAALESFDKLGLQGIAVRAREKLALGSGNIDPAESVLPVIAFSFGEVISDEMAVIHIEKAAPNIIGAYQIINQQLLARCFSSLRYANREEDLGIAGLRQAKRGYNPIFMVEKHRAVL
ncbi:DUF2156 domain-containing protein [Helicobacter zhangjianzhongii]|uniref:Phosphatidylglycerol lysyltransferase domain-containing protein n=1 Tax=Helicobacter zhangjianzhongii TaxID=2974574 RepID=A0ACC6FS57_9HELI|nr:MULTISPECIES: phosphatidylglycerol lysyltransferase domain-containing protein [unclassified Helicobacter]MDL0079871.1 phosphatidylglycerol lysyltransferase domain-containing protein [Helicobacter sp. CPD2-1]MDL0082033.1 phosphatidylglycerol lysyltransferase domain-containing protein [Helicobacter sp. XJK30-2]